MLLFPEQPLWSPTKVASIQFTKQINTLYKCSPSYFVKQLSRKKLGALLEKMPVMDRLKLLKQGSDIFIEHFQLFQSRHSVDLMQITYSDIQMFSWSLIENISCLVFQNLLLPGIQKNSYYRNSQKKVRSKSFFLAKRQAEQS